MAKLTLEEKRLQNLRRQLFGGDTPKPSRKNLKQTSDEKPVEQKSSHSFATAYLTDTSLLKKDLLKILVLTSLLFAAQVGIYFAIQQGLIKI